LAFPFEISLFHYYVCTLDKRDVRVLAQALPLKIQSIHLIIVCCSYYK